MGRANSLGVRKGAWSKEEDDLLTKCVQQFGEGRWHLVPLRTGLNRCRKSCRLRWLNYLRPDITRGNFTQDEIDLVTRLHKLLGNRWSLIAGRIPGRTGNAVKNFWNTRMQEKKPRRGKGRPVQKTNIIRPRPYSFSNSIIKDAQAIIDPAADRGQGSNDPEKLQQSSSITESLPKPSSQEADKCIHWWSNLLHSALDESETDLLFLDE